MHTKLPKLDLNITNRCNLRCRHCAFDSGVEQMPELSIADLRKLLEETKALGGQKIDLTGGEPALRTDLKEILRLAKALGYQVELVSNGTLLTRAGLEELRSAGLDALAISVDGAAPETHAQVRGIATQQFHIVLENIRHAVNCGLYTKVNTLAHQENYRLLPELGDLCLELKVAELGIYYFTPVGRGYAGGLQAIEPVSWLKFIRKELGRFKDRLNISLEVPLVERGLELGFCGCILENDPFHLQILPSGAVYPCAILASYHRPAGYLQYKSVTEIWNDEKGWQNYHALVEQEIFSSKGGACVAFDNFNLADYGRADFKFVCPLRKYTVAQITGKQIA